MHQITKKLEVIFFCTEQGSEPVREWLRELPKEDKQEIGNDIKTVQLGWPIGMPLVGSLGHGLWEVRIKLPKGRIARIIFFLDGNIMILAHGFIKKSQKISKSELDLAIKRKRIYESNRG